MKRQVKWIDRVFDRNIAVELHPELIERLRGTPARLEERIQLLPHSLLIRKDGEKWSIQEHAGHLSDVEALFMGRLDDFDAGKPVLRPAEMSGKKTFDSNHNEREITAVLTSFREVRADYVKRLEGWTAEAFNRTAHHPRLDRPMTVVDMLYFHAEHDDYHLARITELMRRFWENRPRQA